ncbi:MAG TPA: DHA2 family efflux MFS transporter permease subunit [Stellaceae bacterium]|nr:DHA2 family efflux MFS transporter permease subunit [Stellaceae bacterium]
MISERPTASAAHNRGMITATVICACVLQGIDTTIANVALPHIQGSMSAAQDQISWVLTSYIVASAITMPLTGWLAGRFGIRFIFLASVIGFTITSGLCGAAETLPQLVIYRVLQGVFGAGLVPLGQATLLTIYPQEKHGQAMAIFSTGAMMGPILGPTMGGWITDNINWRWCFYVNLPVGALCALGILLFIRQSRAVRRAEFDALGFGMMSVAIGALQLMLDRGQIKDWFHSTEIWIEAIIAGLAFYLLIVHTATAGEKSFVSRELLKSPNFIAGSLLMLAVGWILSGTLALMPSMMQNLMNYPVFDSGWMMAPRGLGTMLAMIFVGRTINRIDGRLFIVVGFALTAASLWQMTGYSLYMGSGPIIFACFTQGFTLGLTFVPLNILALSDLPQHILTQGTALRSLMRMIGGSVGISILEAQLSQNTQIVHSRLAEGLRPDNPLMHGHTLGSYFGLTAPSGVAALNAEVTRQATMVAYIDDFKMMMLVLLCSLPLVLLIRVAPKGPSVAPARPNATATPAAAGED